MCFNETVHNKWWWHKSVCQTENGLERGFVEHWLNSVQITGPMPSMQSAYPVGGLH